MPVPMMLAITIEHAVTKPMVRFGGADLTAARWVSVVIRRNSINFLTAERRTTKSQRPDQRKGRESISVGIPLLHALLDHFRQLSEALQGISLHQHERTSQALRRNGHSTRSFPR